MPRQSDLEKLIAEVLEKAAPSSIGKVVPSGDFEHVLGARYEVQRRRLRGQRKTSAP